MNKKRHSLIIFVPFLFSIVVFLLGFQGMEQHVGSVSGTIEKVEKDHRSILVNGQKVAITPGTKIVDEKGNALKAQDLKQSHSVEVEGLRNVNGFVATKILVKPIRRIP